MEKPLLASSECHSFVKCAVVARTGTGSRLLQSCHAAPPGPCRSFWPQASDAMFFRGKMELLAATPCSRRDLFESKGC